MTRLAIVVEGQTEEEFVKNVLDAHLRQFGIEPEPILLDYHGGDVTVERVAHDLAHSLRPFWQNDFATSLVDFYGFRDKGDAGIDELQSRIDSAVNQIIGQSDAAPRAFAYIQRYEFEALLFSNVDAFAILPGVSAEQITALRAIHSQFPTPEHINDHEDTAPSKRIEVIFRYNRRGYDKRADGYLVAQEIGLDAIRAACPRFGAWLTRLESLGGTGQ